MSGNEEEQTPSTRTSLEALGAGKMAIWHSCGIHTRSKNSQCTLLGLSLRNRLESCNMPEILKTEKKGEDVRAQIQEPRAMVQSREGGPGASLPTPSKYHFHVPSPY